MKVRGLMGRTSRRFATAVADRREKIRCLPDGVEIGNDVRGVDRVHFGGENMVARATKFTGPTEIGYRSTIGEACYLAGEIFIGAYSQLAPHVLVFAADHPLHRLTTFGNPRAIREGMPLGREPESSEPIRIGHDVWIGAGAIILKGVEIGNGAVVGAGAVVTESVPSYGIAVGNPAHVLSYRFSPEIQRLIEISRWWTLSIHELEPLRDAMAIDAAVEPQRMIEALEHALRELGIEFQERAPLQLTLRRGA